MTISFSSIAPETFTFTMPPPAEASTISLAISSCACAICACICWACCISLLMSMLIGAPSSMVSRFWRLADAQARTQGASICGYIGATEDAHGGVGHGQKRPDYRWKGH